MPALTQSHIQKLPPIQPLRILENVKNFQNDGDSEGNGGSNRNSDNTNSNSNSSSIINMKEIVYEPNLIEIASNAIQYTNNAVTAAMAAANDGEDDEEEAEIEVEAEMVDVNVKGDEVQGVIIYEEIMLDDDNVYDETTEKSIQRVTTFSSPPLPSISSSSSTSCTYVSPHFVTANYNATSIPSTVIITNDGRNMNKEKYFLLRQALAKDYATTTTATTTTLTKTTTTKNGISCIQIITKPSLAQENDAIYE